MGGAVLKGLARKTIGLDVDQVSDALAEGVGGGELVSEAIESGVGQGAVQIEKFFDASLEVMVDSFNRTSAAMVDFREKLELAVQAISVQRPGPVFILVDELDRCRPTYAVQLLERVKHLFEVQGVVFVFGTNTSQLQYSIAGAYGARFDGFRYLKRFFDRTYAFEEPSIDGLVASLCQHLPKDKIRSPDGKTAEVLTLGFKSYGFDPRTITQVMEMIEATATAWPHPIPADISLLFPLCVHFFNTGKPEWPSFDDLNNYSWVFRRGSYYDHQGNHVLKDIDINDVYQDAKNMINSLNSAEKYYERGARNSRQEYVRQMFVQEWFNVHLPVDKPSIQSPI